MSDPDDIQLAHLVHPIALLGEPDIGAQPLALLDSGTYRQQEPERDGFLPIVCDNGLRGYVPTALCGAQAVELQRIEVAQDVALYRQPKPGAQFAARWLLAKGETVRVLEWLPRFARVQRSNGQIGFVPATLCRALPGNSLVAEMAQPVALYREPEPGRQFDARWIVTRGEPLLLLGHEGRFELVQRESGEIGYVPAALCGQSVSDALMPMGPADLGWIILGGGWGLINWLGVAIALRNPFVDATFRPFLGLGVLFGVAVALWFLSRRRVAARSFVLGFLLAYAFLHLASGGSVTLWK